MSVKGIILAGGQATRLFPITKVITKQLLPIYDKPMIYYPLSLLMLAKIKDIAIIISPEHKDSFVRLLGDGSQWGVKLTYLIQRKPEGIGQAYLIAEKFLKNQSSMMVLGDNIFYGNGLANILNSVSKKNSPTVFGYKVSDPTRYGVITFKQKKVIEIIEKPEKPKSNFAVTGLYFLDNKAPIYAKKIKKSSRGELEIADILNMYINKNKLVTKLLGRGFAWLDMGTIESLHSASNFVRTIQTRQGSLVGSPEEVSVINKWISKDKILKSNNNIYNSQYFKYLYRQFN